MFNKQLEFGTVIDTPEVKNVILDERLVKIIRDNRTIYTNFRNLKKGDRFQAYDVSYDPDSTIYHKGKVEHENGIDWFIAINDLYRDELGFLCIDIRYK